MALLLYIAHFGRAQYVQNCMTECTLHFQCDYLIFSSLSHYLTRLPSICSPDIYLKRNGIKMQTSHFLNCQDDNWTSLAAIWMVTIKINRTKHSAQYLESYFADGLSAASAALLNNSHNSRRPFFTLSGLMRHMRIG